MNILKKLFVKKKIKKAFDKSEQNIITNREKLRYNSRTIELEDINSLQIICGANSPHYAKFTYKNINKAIIVLIED